MTNTSDKKCSCHCHKPGFYHGSFCSKCSCKEKHLNGQICECFQKEQPEQETCESCGNIEVNQKGALIKKTKACKGECSSVAAQETWEQRLEQWIKTQHGSAGWEQKLENFIRQTILDEKAKERERCTEIVEAKKWREGEPSYNPQKL